MNEKQKKVVRALEQFFENFRKKQMADANRAPGNRKPKQSNRRLENGINSRATTEI